MPFSRHASRDLRRAAALLLVTVVIVTAVAVSLWPSTSKLSERPDTFSGESLAVDSPTEQSNSNTPALAAPSRVAQRIAEQQVDLDPRHDGWESETISELVSQQLTALASRFKNPHKLSAEALEGLVTDDFSCGPLRGQRSGRVDIDRTIGVRRDLIDVHAVEQTTGPFRGAQGLAEALGSMLEPFDQLARIRAKFKVVSVNLSGDTLATRQLVTVSGPSPGGMVQQNATWLARWVSHADSKRPGLQWIGLESFEQVTANAGGGPLFADCTDSILGHNSSFENQLKFGIDYWLQRLEAMLTGPFGHHGLTLGDANGDGLDDLYVCQPGGLPNLLLIQNDDGTATDQSHAAGVDVLDLTRSALLVDLDNDGDQDLVVATMSNLLLFANDGRGRFSLQAKLSQIRDAHSITAADFDNDGRLDIHACVYSGDGGLSRGSPTPIPIHDARNGGRNVLLRNEISPKDSGLWKFSDVTAQTGLDVNNRRWSYAASWEDYDNDGDVDLYVANDFGRNTLYRNDQGRFVDASALAGLEEAAFGMSVTWGDYNQDGFMDVYVSNMFSGAGNRVTTQPRFQPDATANTREMLRYAARGNSLFQNQGDGTFRDVSVQAGVTMGRWAWSSLFSDVNNDGRPDLLVGNGFLTRDDADDL